MLDFEHLQIILLAASYGSLSSSSGFLSPWSFPQWTHVLYNCITQNSSFYPLESSSPLGCESGQKAIKGCPNIYYLKLCLVLLKSQLAVRYAIKSDMKQRFIYLLRQRLSWSQNHLSMYKILPGAIWGKIAKMLYVL